VQLIVIAFLVIIVDLLLKAYLFNISLQLSVFVGLIITNCIIMGRLEAFALKNKPWQSFLDGIGNAFGYGFILIVIGLIRELFGAGTIWGYNAIPESFFRVGYENNGLFIMPPMALIIVGIIIWIQKSCNKELKDEK
jgi:Na+-transporting NADH:ubiquinone oxidoreductase subunit D